METERKFSFSSWLRSPTGLVLLAFLAIAVFYLVTEHAAHFFGFLPYALLLLCPLLHLFMHGGHGGHGGHNGHSDNTETQGQPLTTSGPAGMKGQSPIGGKR